MSKPRLYAFCDSASVAETLAVLLEADFDYLAFLPCREPGTHLPFPALVLDARGGSSERDGRPLEITWPHVRVVRINLLTALDPTSARRAVLRALGVVPQEGPAPEHVLKETPTIAAEIKPRLVATRCLIDIARQGAISAHPAWRTLLREQLLALTQCLQRPKAATDVPCNPPSSS